MTNKSNEVKSTFEPYEKMNQQWAVLFNELCYEVFYNTAMGKRLLAHLENRYFRSPVAVPGNDPSWAFFNEGKNELIRSFTAGMQAHMMAASMKNNPQESHLDKRKRQTKPIQ